MSHLTIYVPNNDKAVVDDEVINLYVCHLEGLTADPASLRNGDIWYRSDLDTVRVKLAAGVKTVTVA